MTLTGKIIRVALLLFLCEYSLCITKEKEFCLEDDAVVHRISDLSYIQCQEECGKRRHCKAINYRRSFNLCELLGTDQGSNAANVQRKQACIFLKKTEMSDAILHGCDCLDGLTCNPVTKTCSVTECSKIVATNAVIFGNMHSIGSRVKFRCNPGYVDVTNVDVTNVMNAVCEASGQWSYLPNCIRDCGTVPNIANAQVISGGVTTTEGAVVQYECLSGYSFNGNPGYLTCTADGIWFDQASVVCVPLISIGGSCSSHSDCTLTNGVCDGENGKCFCSPLYRYKPEINDCFQECTSFTSTFTAFANTGVYGYNALGSSSIDTPSQCEDLCRSDPNCLSFEVWEDDGSLRCNRGTVAYLNILDGDPGSVLTGESWITIYNRDCI